MNFFEIIPNDVLMFRKPKPFHSGGGAVSEWPLPTALLGALRTAVGDKKGMWDKPHKLPFEVAGPWACLHDNGALNPLYPAPLLLQTGKQNNEKHSMRLQPVQDKKHDGLATLWPEKIFEGKPEAPGFLNVKGMETFLSNSTPVISDFIDKGDIWALERRVGIGMDNVARTAEDGKLYSASFMRLQEKAALVAGCSLNPAETPAHFKFGGEGRTVSIKPLKGEDILPKAAKIDENRILFYLASPAFFGNGWIPGWLAPQTLTGTINGVNVKLIAAAVGKPQVVGGFDLNRGGPKPIRRAVPAGSCYLFETAGSAVTLAALHGTCISENDENSRHATSGMGMVFIGKWK
ncbi:MAG: type III-B CRISPR module-associated protein Cmr3 [bacterium]